MKLDIIYILFILLTHDHWEVRENAAKRIADIGPRAISVLIAGYKQKQDVDLSSQCKYIIIEIAKTNAVVDILPNDNELYKIFFDLPSGIPTIYKNTIAATLYFAARGNASAAAAQCGNKEELDWAVIIKRLAEYANRSDYLSIERILLNDPSTDTIIGFYNNQKVGSVQKEEDDIILNVKYESGANMHLIFFIKQEGKKFRIRRTICW